MTLFNLKFGFDETRSISKVTLMLVVVAIASFSFLFYELRDLALRIPSPEINIVTVRQLLDDPLRFNSTVVQTKGVLEVEEFERTGRVTYFVWDDGVRLELKFGLAGPQPNLSTLVGLQVLVQGIVRVATIQGTAFPVWIDVTKISTI